MNERRRFVAGGHRLALRTLNHPWLLPTAFVIGAVVGFFLNT
jgi:hypothetical protein